ncbi:hypothetical protein ESCO_004283 [Escovopsis weberi]|uniref:Uncharacterized protein n=1 Tax=Escovopsis weberi TaxID=150374 RepID=A0A0M9VVK3_ESCWE|nr:hypothetical protein ESCO_004283 [Escovopsis weberi]
MTKHTPIVAADSIITASHLARFEFSELGTKVLMPEICISCPHSGDPRGQHDVVDPVTFVDLPLDAEGCVRWRRG